MSAEGFFGPKEQNLVDLIQMWGLAKATGVLTIKSGNDEGHVHFAAGNVVYAKCGDHLMNEDALYHILSLVEGRFRFVNTQVIKNDGNFCAPYHEVIMEGMRRLDHLKNEISVVEERFGFIPVVVKEVDHATLSGEQKVFIDLVDGTRNLGKVFANCGLGNFKSFDMFNHFLKEGIINLRKVRVLVVDDQSMWRQVVSKMLLAEKHFEIVGTAEDGVDALEKLSQLKPDVMTLDIEMPKLNGLKTLYWMMSGGYDILLKEQFQIDVEETFRCPVVVISAVATKMAKETLEALMGGASGYITKPSQFETLSLEDQQKRIAKTVLMASQVDLIKSRRIKAVDVNDKAEPKVDNARKILTIGASVVGGLNSLMQLVPQLPSDLDGSVIVTVDDLDSIEHAKSFSEFLDAHSKIKVMAAESNTLLNKGVVYISPGCQIIKFGVVDVDGRKQTAFKPVPVDRGLVGKDNHRPIDDMLVSALMCEGFDKRVALMLAGDGDDGKVGCLELAKMEEKVFAQDVYSSLNPQKPESIASTGVARVLPLSIMVKSVVNEIGKTI